MRRIPAGSSLLLAILFTASLLSVPASAQPFDAWLLSTPGWPTTHGYIQIPHHASLNPTGAFTFEAWVLDNRPDGPLEDCRSIAGKNWQQAWWVGICDAGGVHTLRSYLKGGSSAANGGRIPQGQWTHVAVTFNGTHRRHFINGEPVIEQPLAGPLSTSPNVMRIGSDVSWEHSPQGSIDEVRLWNVARTQAQIRASLNVRVNSAQPGLVAVWALDGNGNDIIGVRDGALMGGGANFFISAVAANCGTQTATKLCLANRFQITARWRTDPVGGLDHAAMTVPCDFPGCGGSGLFWFFSNTNWEVMVKSLNGCGLNNRWWLFSAATTNVFYRLEVTDVTKGETKIYFNYQGPPAPAVTDTSAFATCP